MTSSLAEVRQECVGQEARVEPIQKLAFLWRFIPCVPKGGDKVSELEAGLGLETDQR